MRLNKADNLRTINSVVEMLQDFARKFSKEKTFIRKKYVVSLFGDDVVIPNSFQSIIPSEIPCPIDDAFINHYIDVEIDWVVKKLQSHKKAIINRCHA